MNTVPLRQLLKMVVFAVAVLLASPLIVLSWLEKHLLRSEWLFATCAQLLALLPGPPGVYLRGAYYWGALQRCSWEVHIGFGSVFTHRGAELSRRVSTGAYCVIGHGRIGEQVMLASRVSIPSGKRQHLDASGNLADSTHYDHVNIGARSWIGEGAIVMADVGAGCIVSAGAVVSKSMPDHSLIGGNPAKVLRELTQTLQSGAQSDPQNTQLS